MKVINKEVLSLIHHIQDLVLETKDAQLYYQQNVNLFQVYIIKDHEHIYNKSVYIDGSLLDEETVIKNLKQIIIDLEDYKEEQQMGLFKKEEYIEPYVDKDGKEFVVLTNGEGISKVRYVRNLIIETFGNADEYDKIMEEKKKGK